METFKLGEICQIKYGKDHKKLKRGIYPAYGSGGIIRYVDQFLSGRPSVLIPRKGTLNNLFYVDKPFWTVDTLFWTEINTEKAIPQFVYYYLKSQNLATLNIGTAVPSLTISILNELEIPAFDLEDQRLITKLLSSFDEKVILNNRINDYLAVMAMSLFNSQCPQSSEPNAVLSDIAEITMGQSPSGSSYNEDGNGVVFYQGRAEFGSFFPRRRLYTTEPKRMAREGDTLMSIRAPVGDLNVANEGCCIGRGLAAIHSENNQSFVHYLVRAQGRQLDTFNGDGTVFGSINGKALKELPVFLPDNDVITQLESQLKPIDALIRRNDDETQALERMRDTLLPKLMSGEIDVSEIEVPTQLNNHLYDYSPQSFDQMKQGLQKWLSAHL